MKQVFTASALIALLTGCASLPSNTGYGDLYSTQERVQKLMETKHEVSVVMKVPCSVQFLANTMDLAAIQSGSDTSSVLALVAALKQDKSQTITVVGDKDSITAATIISAINNLNGAKSITKLYFAGEQKYADQIKVAADKAAISFESVVYP